MERISYLYVCAFLKKKKLIGLEINSPLGPISILFDHNEIVNRRCLLGFWAWKKSEKKSIKMEK